MSSIRGVVLAAAAWLHITPTAAASRNEIIWDGWGVPHIYASSRERAFYQMGWAQMSAHPNLMARIYGQAKGRAAEHWGGSYEDNDVLVLATRVDERAQDWLARQDVEYQRYLSAYAQGVTDYARRHSEHVDATNRWVFPIGAQDVMAQALRSTFLQFFLESWHLGEYFQAERQAAAAPRGSNGWAIAPGKSANGQAMLLINPHMPWGGDLIFFETHVVTEGIDAYGVSLVGSPMLSIAFTADHGWTHTVNNNDSMDIYELSLRKGGYLYDGTVKPFESRGSRVLQVRSSDGSLRRREVPLLESVHGDVVHVNAKTGKALALRFAGIERAGVIKQYWDMLACNGLDGFMAVTDRLQMPYFNTLYADRAGEILYRYNAALPARSAGDYNFWRQILPGDRSELVWSGYLDGVPLPRVRNPGSGFVQNANDPPWLATWPQQLQASDYSGQLPPPFQYLRSQRSLRMLRESGKLSFEDVVTAKFSTRMELADRVLPELMAVARTSNDSIVREAIAVLTRWDREAKADSRGAVLFIKWAEAMQGITGNEQLALRPTWFAIPWQEADPLATPRGLKDPIQALDALRRAASTVKQSYGSLDVPYGQVYRLRRGKADVPASVAHQSTGSFNSAYFDRAENGTYSVAGGETFIAVVSFGAQPRAEGLLTYGNSSEPDSPHYHDQLEMFSQGKLRPLLLRRADVERSSARRENF